MAETSIATGNNLVRKWVSEKLFRDTRILSWFMPRFSSEGRNTIMQEKTELMRIKGDQITFGKNNRLTGEGITGASGKDLEGNEEDLSFDNFPVILDETSHAVIDSGPMARQRTAFNLTAEMRSSILVWGSERIDKDAFDALTATDPNKIFFPGSVTAVSGLTAASQITPEMISRARLFAVTGGERSQTPIRPIRFGGRNWWVLLVHPGVNFQLKRNSEWQQAHREAVARDGTSPIFTGADSIWDGVIVMEHENITHPDDGGAGSIEYAKNVMLGQQALCWAWGMRPVMTPGTRDWGRKRGFAWTMVSGVARSTFDSKDYGMVGFFTARKKEAA